MTQLPRCQFGTVACLASGPSLEAEDVAVVRGRATVIAVNDAVRLAPWADVLYSSDPSWWAQHKYHQGFAGVRVMVDPIRAHKTYQHPGLEQGVIVLKNTGKEGIEWSPDGLRTAINSGAAAINLAVHLGANRIVLLGYDMGQWPDGRKHFHNTTRTVSYSAYDAFRRFTATMAAPLAEAGIDVVNCSRRTHLTCFRQAPLSEVFPEAMAVAS